MLSDVHSNFGISDKIRVTVTDSGSNFAKAFAEYGLKVQDDNLYPSVVDFADVNSFLSHPPQLSSAMEDSPNDYMIHVSLPQHHRCSSHTLSLVGSADVHKIVTDNSTYGQIHWAAMAKCSAVWNKVSCSPKTSEEFVSVMQTQPVCACPTRWNSLYDNVSNLLLKTVQN